MTVQIDTTAESNGVRLLQQGTHPSNPSAGHVLLYYVTGTASPGLFVEDSSGNKYGPLITGTPSVASSSGIPLDGWISASGTWSYLSADAPSYVASVNVNITGSVGVGDRIRLSQSSNQYFIVTAMSITGSTSYVNLYGGTDYSLANSAISSPCYSPIKAPFGFPLDPAKWSLSVTNTTIQQMNGNSPVANTWYNSISIVAPIGLWDGYYEFAFQYASGITEEKHTLSTANNSESNSNNTVYLYINTLTGAITPFLKFFSLSLTTKTTHYLNHLSVQSGKTVYQTRGDVMPTKIVLVTSYL